MRRKSGRNRDNYKWHFLLNIKVKFLKQGPDKDRTDTKQASCKSLKIKNHKHTHNPPPQTTNTPLVKEGKSHQASFTIIVHTNSLNASQMAHWLLAALPSSAFVARAWWTGGNTCVRSPAAEGGRAVHKTHTYFHVLLNVHVLSNTIMSVECIISRNTSSQGLKNLLQCEFRAEAFICWRLYFWACESQAGNFFPTWSEFFLGDLTRTLVWILNNIFNWY